MTVDTSRADQAINDFNDIMRRARVARQHALNELHALRDVAIGERAQNIKARADKLINKLKGFDLQ